GAPGRPARGGAGHPHRRGRRGPVARALRRADRVAAAGSRAVRGLACGAGARRRGVARARVGRRGLDRGLARRVARRAGARRRRPHPPLPLPRPVVAELAGARARGHRQHRSRLPADQQVVQPQLFGTRPLMWKIARQIVRTGIRTEPAPQADAAARTEIERIGQDILEVLGRALTIRAVDAGSCNGCELELHALNNPYYNLEGLGIKFVASPRHADMLLVTGPVSRHMELALRRTWEATPEPRLVVAIGDCGCTGGIFGESYATRGRVSNVIPVDVEVPGCPPAPLEILRAILAAVRRA